MLSSSRLLRKASRSNSGSGLQPQAITKSPSSSPVKEAHEPKPRSRANDPHPIPSNNPASQYTLLEKLGTGSFGVVYKAIHNETKQIVAIKQIGEWWMRAPLLRCVKGLADMRVRVRLRFAFV